MMKLKTISFALLAALALVGCNKEDGQGNGQNAGNGDIYIRLSQETLGSRAVTDPFEEAVDVYTTFHNGGLFFADAAGNITNPFIVGNESSANVKPAELQAGYIFTGINASATRVIVVANVDFAPATSFSTLEALVEDYKINLKDQVTDLSGDVDDDLSIDYATMWGEGLITMHTSTQAEPWEREASVNLTPVIARFELGKMTATKYTENNVEGIDTDYKIDGIFLNNYYFETGLNGQAADAIADLINWKKAYEKYFPNDLMGNIPDSDPVKAYDGQYDVDYAGLIYDYYDPSITASNHVGQADAGKVWAYNAFATSQATPHIIIKLSNIKQNGTLRTNEATGIPGSGYITINRYLDLDDMTSIYPIENGTVYSIDDLEFSFSDIKDTPEPGEDFSVKVTVKVVPWKVLKVGGGIDRG